MDTRELISFIGGSRASQIVAAIYAKHPDQFDVSKVSRRGNTLQKMYEKKKEKKNNKISKPTAKSKPVAKTTTIKKIDKKKSLSSELNQLYKIKGELADKFNNFYYSQEYINSRKNALKKFNEALQNGTIKAVKNKKSMHNKFDKFWKNQNDGIFDAFEKLEQQITNLSSKISMIENTLENDNEVQGQTFSLIDENGNLMSLAKIEQKIRNNRREMENNKLNKQNKDLPFKYNENLDKFYSLLNNFLTLKSKRQLNNMIKEFDNINIIDIKKILIDIVNYGKQIDFYPTPNTLFNLEGVKNIIESSNHFFEPTAGLGNIIQGIKKLKNESFNNSYNSSIVGNELNNQLYKYLLELQGGKNTKIYNESFFDFTKNDINKFKTDCIIINPPFTLGNDKRYYYDFLFHCLNISKGKNMNIIFICPSLYDNEIKNSYLPSLDLFNKLSMKKQITNFNKYLNINITSKDIKNESIKYVNALKNIVPKNIKLEGLLNGFGGTNITASVYSMKI